MKKFDKEAFIAEVKDNVVSLYRRTIEELYVYLFSRPFPTR